jgi:hypothetical protein
VAIVTAALGIWLVSIGVVGYFTRPIGLIVRVLFAVAGILSLIPADTFPGAEITDVLGAGIGAVLIGWEMWAMRRGRPQQPVAAAR